MTKKYFYQYKRIALNERTFENLKETKKRMKLASFDEAINYLENPNKFMGTKCSPMLLPVTAAEEKTIIEINFETRTAELYTNKKAIVDKLFKKNILPYKNETITGEVVGCYYSLNLLILKKMINTILKF